MNELVLYKEGQLHIEAQVRKGRCLYSGTPIEEYMKKHGPGIRLISFREAMEEIRKAEEFICSKPWKEISRAKWQEMFVRFCPRRTGRTTVKLSSSA